MRIARMRTADGTSSVRLDGEEAVEIAEDWYRLPPAGPGPAVANGGRRWPVAVGSLLAPVVPGKIIAVGLNYRDHALESGMALPERPLLFAKLPSAVTGPFDPIECMPEVAHLDYEGEVGVVVGRRGRHVSQDDAWDHVAGLTVVNDVSARDAQFADQQWTRGKSFDTFCPVGPWIRTVDDLVDRDALEIRTWVNGELRQHSNTRQLVFGVAALVAYCSRYFTLHPGDLILTGTPAGVGLGLSPPAYLAVGDVVEVEVGGVGRIRNTVVAAAGAGAALVPVAPGAA